MSAFITAVVLASVVSVGTQQSAAHKQRKATKTARHEEDMRSQAALAEAKEQEEKSERQSSVRAAKARQQALAAGATQKGRSGTIKTGGLGSAITTEKTITGG